MMGKQKAAIALAALCFSSCARTQDEVFDDTYFYGQSPPVCPSPEAPGTGGWADAYSKARALVAQMNLDERVSITGGYRYTTSGSGGNIPATSRLGFNGMYLMDGLNGVRAVEFVYGYPSGIHAGARYVYTHFQILSSA